jgi:methionine aminotransferase
MNISSKLPDVGTTIFTVMSQLAVEHNAINLGQGFPDFMMSEDLIALVNDAMRKGYNQYAHMNGLPILRQRIAAKLQRLYNASVYSDSQITITPGGTYAIYTALTAILQSGDEVIVFEPAYDSYIPNITINGAIPVRIELQYPDYSIPWNEVKQKLSTKTKAIIINSPHNPTGAVLRKEDIDALRAIVDGTNIFIISDEVYEHLIYDNLPHLSILRYPDLLQRSFVCFSFGKTYHCTGWKIGYCIAAPLLMEEFRKVHQFNCFSCNSTVQYALAAYLQEASAYLRLGGEMQQKRDYLQNLLAETSLEPIPSYGSYFQCYSYKNYSDKSDKELAKELTVKAGVTAIPMSAFYQESNDYKVLRFCFAKKEETLLQAANKLTQYLK